jgi:hypothetical protein
VWPGGGITYMVDVTTMPARLRHRAHAALVAPLEFTLTAQAYRELGGHTDRVRTLASLDDVERLEARPWPPR